MIATSLLAMAAAMASPASASAQMPLNGPVVPGVCILSPEALITDSKAGQAANLRFQQLAQDAQREAQAERQSLDTEAKTLEGQPQASAEPRQQALTDRRKALQQKIELRGRELEYTRMKVIGRISTEAQPIITAAYASHGCGMLLRRGGVIGGNPTNDLTAETVRGLDAKITEIPFERESLPAATASSK